MNKKVIFTGSMQGARDLALDLHHGRLTLPEDITAQDILNADQQVQQPAEKSDNLGDELKSQNSTPRRGNKNALMHGIYSDDLVLPWESEEDLQKLHEELKAEYQPEGCSEEHAVFSLTWLMWMQRRVNNMALLQFQAGMPDVCDLTPWRAIVAYQRKSPEEIEKLSESAKEMLQAIETLAEKIRNESFSAPTSTPAGKEAQYDLSQLRADVARLCEQFENKGMPAVRNLDLRAEQRVKLFNKAYQPDEIERLVAIMGAIDARIEKALWRLTAIKEFKKVRAPSLIPSQRQAPHARLNKKVAAKADLQIESVVASSGKLEKK